MAVAHRAHNGQSGSVTARRTSLIVAAVFVLYVGVAVGLNVWEMVSGPEEVDMASLVQELDQFTVPSGATSSPAAVAACTAGESPYAERQFEVHTASVEEAAADLASQAPDLGWTPIEEGLFKGGGRLLIVGGWGSDETGVESEGVILTLAARGDC
jgi:hypothetical protein